MTQSGISRRQYPIRPERGVVDQVDARVVVVRPQSLGLVQREGVQQLRFGPSEHLAALQRPLADHAEIVLLAVDPVDVVQGTLPAIDVQDGDEE
jgi:hypothetical protein